jgi:hypothetical protein
MTNTMNIKRSSWKNRGSETDVVGGYDALDECAVRFCRIQFEHGDEFRRER